MPAAAPDSLRRQVRLLVHRTCVRAHQQGATAPDFESPLAELLARDNVVRPDEAVLSRWLEEDQADFDRAVLVSQLIAQSEPRVVIAPAPVKAGDRAPLAAQPAAAAAKPPRRTGSPSVTDLLDGMFAQQGGR